MSIDYVIKGGPEGKAGPQAKEPTECRHLKGTWERRGTFSVMKCENEDYAIIVDVDSPEAYNLYEGGRGAIQLFGKPLKPVPDDAERFQEMISMGLDWP